MSIRTFSVLLAAALLMLGTPGADAQSTNFDIEAGYQWVDVSGSEDMYRTQINQRDGFVLKNLDFDFVDSSGDAGWLDSLSIDASGFGGNPAGRFRLTASYKQAYRLRLGYRHFELYSALPGFANPFVQDGVVPGQHTWERDRDTFDLELEVLPGHVITPIVGYRWNRQKGPSRTTYHIGQDEFRLHSDVQETEEELYAGISFRVGDFQGTVVQGWRDFESEGAFGLVPGAGGGNSSRPVLGEDVTLDDLQRRERTQIDTPVTTATVRGRLGSMARLLVTYVNADASGDTTASEMLGGSLVSYQVGRYLGGLDQSIESRTENPSWRGKAQVDLDLTRHLGLLVGYEKRHRELEGWALISDLYLDTLNFGGYETGDLLALTDVQNGYERDDEMVSARLSASGIGPFSLWVEGGELRRDLWLSEDVSQIVVPGNQQGAFDRDVSMFSAGASVYLGGARVSLDVGRDSATNIVVRTDFNDRNRLRARADLPIVDWLRVLVTAELINSDNTSSGTGFEAETLHRAIDLDLTPVENLSFRLAYDNYETTTEVPVRQPADYSSFMSDHAEDGTFMEGGLTWRVGSFDVDLGHSCFENRGSFDLDLARTYGRVAYDFGGPWSAAVELESLDYDDGLLQAADYEAERYGVFLRWRP